MRKTKIVATLSSKIPYNTLKEMAKIFDCARINLSHGTFDDYKNIVVSIRKIEKELNKYIPILFDLSGPKIRVTTINNISSINRGDKIILSKAPSEGTITINFPEIIDCLHEGQRVYIDDGKIRFKVKEVKKDKVILEALTKGIISLKKGVNFPDTSLPLPSLTEKDIKDIKIIKELEGDFVALSFVRHKNDILELREELNKNKLDIPIIAKVERPEAIPILDEIVDVSDGVMVARGDLGVELSLEKVPIIQKRIIELCKEKGKPVIVATQILETMVDKPEPTRAEVSDIANAIFDGCDALMLSGETAYGQYPIEALKVLDSVSKETELHIKEQKIISIENYRFLKGDPTSAIAFSAVNTALNLNAKAIVCLTVSGQTASLISKFRSKKPVYAVSYKTSTLRKVCLFYGVQPLKVKKSDNTDDLMYEMERAVLLQAKLKESDLIIMTIGLPVAKEGNTNIMKIHNLGGYLPYKSRHLPKKKIKV
ncbi:MAG: pyruvate kinase [Proteobacteria bacterium]|nr:pyruvate kinase [Pseudomonadota bacterium]